MSLSRGERPGPYEVVDRIGEGGMGVGPDSEFNEGNGSFSPDARWIAYTANESGRPEVYVRPFAAPGSGAATASGRWQVSKDGAATFPPRWRADGRELYFRTVNGTPMAVSLETGPTLQAGIPRRLFTLPPNVGAWTVTADGKRILAAMLEQQNAQEPITVVLNWEAGVKR
jgi:hypothetical protein